MTDSEYMQIALCEADKALRDGEIPIGAVIRYRDTILAAAHNQCEAQHDSFAHAEMMVLKKAMQRLSARRLTLCQLYVTIEPCPMCAGAILNARVGRLVYGASDAQYGGISRFHMDRSSAFNHTLPITKGILEADCQKRMDSFFAGLRKLGQ